MQKQFSFLEDDGNLVPPNSNTGAQSTGQRILIDWFAFTLPQSVDVFEVIGIPEQDWSGIETKVMGYSFMYMHGAMRVYTTTREDMGTHVEFSGTACREFEFFFDNDWSGLVKRVQSKNGHFTRIDLAIDDFDGIFSLEQIEQKVRAGEVLSYFRRGRVLEEFNLSEIDNLGKTVYFGSPQSRIRIRMYDKSIETLLKDQSSRELAIEQKELRDNLSKNQRIENKSQREEFYRLERLNKSQIWNRTEIQVRDERADVIAMHIAAGLELGGIVYGTLKNYLNFVEASKTDSNKSRWPVSEFWQKFLGIVEELKLTISKKVKTVKQVREWIVRQVAPSLALLSLDKDLNVNMEEIFDLTLLAVQRLTKRHLAMIQAA